MRFNEIINEAEARIQHAEDLIFFHGSAGAKRALDSWVQEDILMQQLNGMDLPQSFLAAMKMESSYLQTSQALVQKDTTANQKVLMTLSKCSSTVVVERTEINQAM